jgi:hypothetical protein
MPIVISNRAGREDNGDNERDGYGYDQFSWGAAAKMSLR